jgi:hypothetical protein
MDAAATLAVMIPGERSIFAFSDDVVPVDGEVSGLRGIELIKRAIPNNGTYLGRAVHFVNQTLHDRLIVLTDEQSHDSVPAPRAERAYMINVAPYRNGVGYSSGWTHIDGFSEQTLRFIAEYETLMN